MENDSAFRIGPLAHAGLTLTQPEQLGHRQYYGLEIRGESPNHGFSRVYLRGIGLYELLELPQLNFTAPESDPDAEAPTERTTRLHHQLLSLGFESPLFYEFFSPLNIELGWIGGFTFAQVKFRDPQQATNVGALIGDFAEIQPTSLGAQQKTNPAQQDAQFAGGEVGVYSRFYHLYPLVPYVSGRLHLGSFFDTNGFINGVEQSTSNTTNTNSTEEVKPTFRRVYQSTFTPGAMFTLGADYYLGSRSLIGLEYSLWNWNWNRESDWTQFFIFKGGILF